MNRTHFTRGLRGSTALSAFVVAGALLAAPAWAQTATPPAQGQEAQAPESEAIVVTGSVLARTNTETASPVTVLDQQTLSRAGTTSVADAIRSVSADNAGSIPTGF